MKKLPIPLLAGLVLLVVFFGLHASGVLAPRDEVQVQVDRDIASARSAFQTIDLDQATYGARFEPPKMLNPPDVIPPLLKYPPSEQTLAQMTGGY